MSIDESVDGLVQSVSRRLSSFSHLLENKMSYCEHFSRAMHISFTMALASMKNCIHAFYPDVFTTSASDTVKYLNDTIFAGNHADSALDQTGDQLP